MLSKNLNKNKLLNTPIESIFPITIGLESINCEYDMQLINKDIFITRNPRLYNKPNLF